MGKSKDHAVQKGIEKVTLARGRLALYGGFWMPLAAKLRWVPDPELSKHGAVAMTDGVSVFYDPLQFAARSQGEVTFILVHEIGHCMLSHMCRIGQRDPRQWNDAIDAVLNEMLLRYFAQNHALGADTPGDAVLYASLPRQYPGWKPPPGVAKLSAEALYASLTPYRQANSGDGGVRLDMVMPPPPPGQSGGGDKGSRDKPQRPGSGGKASQQQEEELAKSWTLATQAAAVMAKQQGALPGFLEEWVADLVSPKIDWRSQLRQAMTRAAKDEQSWRKFNRRHIWRGAYLPGMHSERIGRLLFGVDTSGSIRSAEFTAALGAMTDIIEELRPDEVVMLQCDTRLHSEECFTSYDLPLPKVKMFGRGGTDLNPIFEWAAQREQEFDAIVVQTDGEIPAVRAALTPTIPMIWVCTGGRTDHLTFGTVVKVEV